MYNIVMKHWAASSPRWTAKWFPHLHYSSFILPISFPLHPFSVWLPFNPSVIDKVGVAFIFFPLHINFQATIHKAFSTKREKVLIGFVDSLCLLRYQLAEIWITAVGVPYCAEPAEVILQTDLTAKRNNLIRSIDYLMIRPIFFWLFNLSNKKIM
jgi:hypothetical protein